MSKLKLVVPPEPDAEARSLMNTLDFGLCRAPLMSLRDTAGAGVLAIITRTEGPSYRPVGAIMALMDNQTHVGTLSSGCVEADLALHATEVLQTGRPKTVLYGRGSPYIDIQLPCGGGLEIMLLPDPDTRLLGKLIDTLEARKPATLVIDLQSGALDVDPVAPADINIFSVRFEPELRSFIFGKGPEASTFARLVQSAGYPNILLSPNDETLADAAEAGCVTRHLSSRTVPADIVPDAWSSVVLFFHDHDWEPPILAHVLETDAFYIGAQGSRRAHEARMLELEKMGVSKAARHRVRGPIGLVPSARDARTLAVSVLAEVLAVARGGV